MPVRKRKGTPYYHYDFTIEGCRFRGSTQAETRHSAKLVEHGLREKILKGEYGKQTVTLDGAAGLYWESHAFKLPSQKTIDYQLENLKNFFGPIAINNIQNRNIADYKMIRRASVSESSVNRELAILRAVINKAVNEWGYEGPRINWKSHFFTEPDPRDVYITPKQASTLMGKAHDSIAEMIRFTLYTGIRKGNCLNLKWAQIDFQARQITFRIKSRKPGGKVHVVPMVRPCMLFLANLDRRGEHVFNRINFRKRWEAAREAAGLDLRWHDLRHTCASWLVQEGVPLDSVMKILGHSDIRTTMRYAHRIDQEKRLGLEKIAALIGRGEEVKKDKSLDKKKKLA